MNEKKKALVVLGISAVLLVVIVVALFASLVASNKKIEELKNVMNSEEAKIVYLAKDTCYYCNLIKPITTFLEKEFNLDYYNIDANKLTSSELIRVLDTLDIDYETFGTPYIVIVKNGKKIDEHVGYTDEDVLFELFKKNGIINEDASLNMTYLDEIDSTINSKESSLVLIGESGDTSSIEARMNLRSLAKENSINIKYFDTSKLTDKDEYSNLLSKLEVDSLPILVKIENGYVISKETSISEYEAYLRENGYIE